MRTDEAEQLALMSKTIGEPVKWRLHQKKLQRYRFSVRVIGHESTQLLTLVGTASPSKWSFVLLGPSDVRLRKISTPHPGHFNCDGEESGPKHKHYWTEEHEDRCTYEPDDIRWDNLNEAFIDFTRECNIELLHSPPELHFQGDLL